MPTPAQDLSDKLTLEARFLADLGRFDNDTVRGFTRALGFSGLTAPDLSGRSAGMRDLLREQYATVGNIFSNRIRPELPEDVPSTNVEGTKILSALAAFYLELSVFEAEAITETTQDDAARALDFARNEQQLAAESGQVVSRLELAVIAGASLASRLRGRAGSRATTEVQIIAEAAKATEAEVLVGLPPSVSGGSAQRRGIHKEWISVGDSRVRPAHLTADGQQRPMNEPFEVDGQQLRWPGDRSLGASLKNIINCRCGAGYDTQGIIDMRRAQERNA